MCEGRLRRHWLARGADSKTCGMTERGRNRALDLDILMSRFGKSGR